MYKYIIRKVAKALLSEALLSKAVPGHVVNRFRAKIHDFFLSRSIYLFQNLRSERGDVPGWVLVVLMTTGLVTGIWTLAAPRIDAILRNSLDSMNGIR